MDDLLIAANVLLWVFALILAGLVYALARQVSVLYDRVAPAGALAVNQTLSVGAEAPRLHETTLAGEPLMLGVNQLLFFMAPDCPICKTLIPVLRSLRRDDSVDVDIVLASDGGTDAEHREYVRTNRLDDFPYIVSEAVGRAYGVGKLPYAVLIDADGAVAALGIVNSREHLESLFVARDMNVASIQDYMEKR